LARPPVVTEKQHAQYESISAVTLSDIVVSNYDQLVTVEQNHSKSLIIYPAPSPALAPRPFRYQKQRFVSHNRKHNQKMKMLYGSARDKDRTTAALQYVPPLPEPGDIDRPAWKIVASDEKLDA
jgi:hypothetical protein